MRLDYPIFNIKDDKSKRIPSLGKPILRLGKPILRLCCPILRLGNMDDSKFGLPNLKIGTQTWNSKFGLPNLKIGQIPSLGTTDTPTNDNELHQIICNNFKIDYF